MAAAAGPIIESLLASGALNGVANNIGNSASMGGGSSLGGPMEIFEKSLSSLEAPFRKVSGLIDRFHQSLQALEAPFKSLESLFRSIEQYVGKFSPADAQFFDRAVADFQAAIGETILPLMELGTKIFRSFGNEVATLMPIIRPMFKDFADGMYTIFNEVMKVWKDVSRSAAFQGALVMLKTSFQVILKTIEWFVKGLGEIIRVLSFGHVKIGEIKDQSSVGKAYAPAQITSSQGYFSQLQTSAFGQSDPFKDLTEINKNTKGIEMAARQLAVGFATSPLLLAGPVGLMGMIGAQAATAAYNVYRN